MTPPPQIYIAKFMKLGKDNRRLGRVANIILTALGNDNHKNPGLEDKDHAFAEMIFFRRLFSEEELRGAEGSGVMANMAAMQALVRDTPFAAPDTAQVIDNI